MPRPHRIPSQSTGKEEAARILSMPIADAIFAATMLPERNGREKKAKRKLTDQLLARLKRKTRGHGVDVGRPESPALALSVAPGRAEILGQIEQSSAAPPPDPPPSPAPGE